MSNVIPFKRKIVAHYELERLHCREDGVSVLIPRYFLNFIEEDGSVAFGIWDGLIYSEALQAAIEDAERVFNESVDKMVDVLFVAALDIAAGFPEREGRA
jgi:hypothetical protein